MPLSVCSFSASTTARVSSVSPLLQKTFGVFLSVHFQRFGEASFVVVFFGCNRCSMCTKMTGTSRRFRSGLGRYLRASPVSPPVPSSGTSTSGAVCCATPPGRWGRGVTSRRSSPTTPSFSTSSSACWILTLACGFQQPRPSSTGTSPPASKARSTARMSYLTHLSIAL